MKSGQLTGIKDEAQKSIEKINISLGIRKRFLASRNQFSWVQKKSNPSFGNCNFVTDEGFD